MNAEREIKSALYDKGWGLEYTQVYIDEIRADERIKTIEEAEKLLDKIAPDKVAEIKCYDGEIRNRPLIDFAKVYEILEQMKEKNNE